MNRFAALALAFALSGAVAVAATLAVCPPMPCCVGSEAKVETPSPNCCSVSKAPTEQPRNSSSKITVEPKLLVVETTHFASEQSHANVAADVCSFGSPPTVHRRLATLSTLLI